MRVRSLVFISSAMALAVAGCHRATQPLGTGQVVATVNGQEITASEINAELDGRDFPDKITAKHFERAALDSLIARKILVGIARARGIDQQGNYAMQRHRAEELLLSEDLQRSIASDVPVPGDGEVDLYMAHHPERFAKRYLFALDQIKFRAPDDPAALKPLATLDTLNAIEQHLIETHTPYQKQAATLDPLAADDFVVRGLAHLGPDSVFLVPKGDVIYASHILRATPAPFMGPKARAVAANALQAERIEAATVKALDSQIKAARATVRYQAGYGPPQNATR